MIPLSHVLSPHRQALRTQLGIRRGLVEMRAGYVTMVRGLARVHGVKLPSCKVEDFARSTRASRRWTEGSRCFAQRSLSLAKTPSALEPLTIHQRAWILPGSMLRLLVAILPTLRSAMRSRRVGVGTDSPCGRPIEQRPGVTSNVGSLPRVGGLHHRYAWRKAA